jgi:HK97 gp10 family phage protein
VGRTGVRVRVNNFPRIVAALPGVGRQAVEEALAEIETHIRLAMAASGSGRIYRRKDRTHQASAPGEAPAIDYGILSGSIQQGMTGETSGAVYTNMLYAVYLEFGTRHLAARPFMVPAADAIRPAFIEHLRSSLERGLR